ncbi:DUF2214 family protein [Lewinella cohaerens]|uniref:DUF2214 family protein n=1 Tax=Lewinella cohaerens TaxID=70995 RepID=UPI000381325B|nr:DUF2214 family protein [Lewinella cohaerens]
MSLEILVRYLHFIGIFTWVSALVLQWVLLKPLLSRQQIQQLAKIDMVYGLSAMLVVGMGLTLWFGLGKPTAYYSENPIFHAKVGLAVIVGLLSIYPTVFFARHRKGDDPTSEVVLPARIRQVVTLELVIMLVIPFLATLMAAGVGR